MWWHPLSLPLSFILFCFEDTSQAFAYSRQGPYDWATFPTTFEWPSTWVSPAVNCWAAQTAPGYLMTFVTSRIVMGPEILRKLGIAPNLAYNRIHLEKQFKGQLGRGSKYRRLGLFRLMPTLSNGLHIWSWPLRAARPFVTTLECKLDKEMQDSTSHI